MNHAFRFLSALFAVIILTSMGCSVKYGFQGIDTSGAETFSVDFFKLQTPKASQEFAQAFTEEFKTIIQAQSPLDLVEQDGQLEFSGAIVGYQVSPVAVTEDQTASLNRLTVRVKVKYVNNVEEEKSFDSEFFEFAEYESNQDFFSVEASLWEEIIEKLSQSIYNGSLGNW